MKSAKKCVIHCSHSTIWQNITATLMISSSSFWSGTALQASLDASALQIKTPPSQESNDWTVDKTLQKCLQMRIKFKCCGQISKVKGLKGNTVIWSKMIFFSYICITPHHMNHTHSATLARPSQSMAEQMKYVGANSPQTLCFPKAAGSPYLYYQLSGLGGFVKLSLWGLLYPFDTFLSKYKRKKHGNFRL